MLSKSKTWLKGFNLNTRFFYHKYNSVDKKETIEKTLALFDEGYSCSQSVLLTFSPRFNLDEQNSKLIASTFGGGMGRLREKCGAVTGGFMVLGLAYGNADPKDMEKKLAAYKKVRELDSSVVEKFGTARCKEILVKYVTETEVEERKHHKIICRKVVESVTEKLYDMLENDQSLK